VKPLHEIYVRRKQSNRATRINVKSTKKNNETHLLFLLDVFRWYSREARNTLAHR
jgi:hypothetical protein